MNAATYRLPERKGDMNLYEAVAALAYACSKGIDPVSTGIPAIDLIKSIDEIPTVFLNTYPEIVRRMMSDAFKPVDFSKISMSGMNISPDSISFSLSCDSYKAYDYLLNDHIRFLKFEDSHDARGFRIITEIRNMPPRSIASLLGVLYSNKIIHSAYINDASINETLISNVNSRCNLPEHSPFSLDETSEPACGAKMCDVAKTGLVMDEYLKITFATRRNTGTNPSFLLNLASCVSRDYHVSIEEAVGRLIHLGSAYVTCPVMFDDLSADEMRTYLDTPNGKYLMDMVHACMVTDDDRPKPTYGSSGLNFSEIGTILMGVLHNVGYISTLAAHVISEMSINHPVTVMSKLNSFLSAVDRSYRLPNIVHGNSVTIMSFSTHSRMGEHFLDFQSGRVIRPLTLHVDHGTVLRGAFIPLECTQYSGSGVIDGILDAVEENSVDAETARKALPGLLAGMITRVAKHHEEY